MLQQIVPPFLEDTILSYLKDQEVIGEGYTYTETFEVKQLSTQQEIRNILDDLIIKVNKRIACRDKYENLKTWHHQYPLFDLSDYIPNFCVDEDIAQKLAFRETLLISEVDPPSTSREVKPRAVGGLCLDVQIVNGHQPVKRELPIDAEIDRQVLQILRNIKKVPERNLSGLGSYTDKEIQKKLEEYEEILKTEMQHNVKKFLVHFSSQFDVDNRNAGSTITAWVDRYFHTLEEKRTEFVKNPHGLDQKTIYTAIQNEKYYMRHSSTVENLEVKKYYPFTVTKELILEGANFILMRYLAVTKFVGTIELSTMYITGDMCRNIYECIGPKPGLVNGRTIEVCKIFRYIIEECGIEHHSVTVLTTYGRIVTHEWSGCNYILNMNPLQYVDNKPPSKYNRTLASKTWENDIQLMSKYLDCKTTAEKNMKTYMSDHPEVQELISDYMQNVLLLKPENILDFTMCYFQNLYPYKLPLIAYLEDPEKAEENAEN